MRKNKQLEMEKNQKTSKRKKERRRKSGTPHR